MRAAVLVPVKDFRAAKRRLSSRLTPTERAELARRMAARVLTAAAPLPVFVVCDDVAVAEWADDLGAAVIWRPKHGLNGAVRSGIASLAAEGFTRAVVAHSDLPLARDLARFATGEAALVERLGDDDVVIAPDRHGRGTNVLSLSATSAFNVAYGNGSYQRHVAEAGRLGLVQRTVHDPELSWDVDTPADLEHPDLKEFLAWLPMSPANPR